MLKKNRIIGIKIEKKDSVYRFIFLIVGYFFCAIFANDPRAPYSYGAEGCIKCYEDLDYQGVGIECIRFDGEIELKLQKAKDRIWRSIYLKKLFSLNEKEGLLNPIKTKLDNIGNAYIYDNGDLSIKKFSSDGKFVQKIGKGRGEGPGEFLNITDFDIKDNGEIWVCDPILGYITAFDVDGMPVKTYRTKEPPYRIGLLNTGLFVVIPSFFLDSLPFSVYNQKGEISLTFNLPPPWKEKFPSSLFLKMDGWLLVDANDYIYYAFARVGMIACFSPKGNLSYLIETIDRTPPPEVLTSKGIIRIDPASPWTAGSISSDASKLYILSLVGSKNRKGSVIDVYRSHDGAYLYSFEIPEKCTSAYVTEQSIVAISEGRVTRWEVVGKDKSFLKN